MCAKVTKMNKPDALLRGTFQLSDGNRHKRFSQRVYNIDKHRHRAQ